MRCLFPRLRLRVAMVAISGIVSAPRSPPRRRPRRNRSTAPCVTTVSGQPLNAIPAGDGSQTLGLVFVIFGPGAIGSRTPPGAPAEASKMGINRGGPASAGATAVGAASGHTNATMQPIHTARWSGSTGAVPSAGLAQ